MKVLKSMSSENEDIITRKVNDLELGKEDIQDIVFNFDLRFYTLFYLGESDEEIL